ncbi:phosphatase PAP2 family protein [Micromonospora costi]|uniref:phosphatase PAP2 family protein n=1 Tax=Micromonospora costi TaxID=1530042 RepID=UPI001319C068|nr:phosphatase PAP2 family protein [Micromonospora costi]
MDRAASDASLAQPPAAGPSPVRRHPPAGGAPGPGRLLAAAGGSLLALALTGGVFLWTRAGQGIDALLLPRAERGGGYEQRTVLLSPARTVLAVFGSPLVLVVLLGAVLLVGVLGRRAAAGATGVALVLGTAAVAGAAKAVLPRAEFPIESSTAHNSFPSGHVSVAAALLLAFMLVLPRWARWWLALPGAAGVSAVAAATMIAGWHRFSDALGGVLLAVTLCCLAVAALARHDRPDGGADGHPPGRTAPYGPVGAAAGTVGLVWALLVVVPSAPLERGPLVAIVTATGLTALAVAAVVFLLDSTDFVASAARRNAPAPAGAGRPAPAGTSPAENGPPTW